MNQLHITLEENSPAIKWANTQADRIGARGHVGTHLDCYTTVPEKPEYNITAMVLDCQNEMPKEEDIKSLTTLENMALLLHTPLFIIIDSHGIAEKGKRHIEFDKICEANGCHVIENVDLSCIGNQKEVQLKILININHQSTGKPCELYCV